MLVHLQCTVPLSAVVLLAISLIGAFLPSAAIVHALPPSAALANGQDATLVLGQANFTSTAVATSQNGMTYPGGLAVDLATGKVFVADSSNHRVLRFASLGSLTNGANAEGVLGQTNFTSNTATASRSGMNAPLGMEVDSAGRLWVADSVNNRVLRFDNAASKANGANADGVLGQATFTSNTAATSQSGMNKPFGVAVDSAGRLWVPDEFNHRVLRFDNAASKANGANADGVLGQADFTSNGAATSQSRLKNPLSVAVDSAGRLWVADSRNNRALRFDNAASKANGANADGVLGQADFTSGSGATSQSRLKNLFGVKVDTAGRLWVADTYNHRVLWFDNAASKANGANADGVLGQADFTSNGAATSQSRLNNPLSVAVDSNNQPWVADNSNSRALYFGPLPSNNADLSSLALSSGTLSPAFAAATTSYSADVANAVSSLTVTPTAADSGATITVNGVAVLSGSASGAIPLSVGVNTITVVVTAANGVTTKTTTITVTRAAPSSNADLSSLALSSGTLSPAFAAATTSYTADVANAVSSLTVTPTAADSGATITVNGVAVLSGSASGAIPLSVGVNTITVVVTAANGVTTKTTTITVTRAALSSNADLSGLTLNSGTLSPAFNAATTSYTADVANSISSLTVTSTAADAGATITINGVAVLSGSASGAIPLSVGVNTITVVVTAANGVTTKTTTITVTRAATLTNGQNATLVLGQASFTSNAVGATQSGMNKPDGVAVDLTSGKVFVADSLNNRVLRFASLGALANGANAEAVLGQTNFTSTTAATSQSGMNAPLGMAVDSVGRLWVADNGSNRVLRFDAAASKANGANADGVLGQATFTSNTAATSQSGMNKPFGVAVDSAGRLWVADEFNHRVLRFDAAASKANGANADGVLGQPNFTSGSGATSQSRMRNPLSVAVDSAGRLWVADKGNNRVLRFDAAASKANGANADNVLGQANFTNRTTAIGQNRMNGAFGVAVDAVGRLWVADTYNNRVLRFDAAASKGNGANADGVLGQPNFTSATQATNQSGMFFPQGVVVDSNNQPWVADTYNNRALYFAPLSSNANLGGLTISGGTISPAFDAAVTNYTANVGSGFSSLSVTPTVADTGSGVSSLSLTPTLAGTAAIVTVNGVPITSGSTSSAISLGPGVNTITIVVTAPDGATTKTYTITATRPLEYFLWLPLVSQQ